MTMDAYAWILVAVLVLWLIVSQSTVVHLQERIKRMEGRNDDGRL